MLGCWACLSDDGPTRDVWQRVEGFHGKLGRHVDALTGASTLPAVGIVQNSSRVSGTGLGSIKNSRRRKRIWNFCCVSANQ